MRKQTRPCAWHLNSARLGYLASGLQEVGPELGLNSSPSLLSLRTQRICNNHHDGTILIPLQLIFLLICDMTRNLHWFVLQFRSSMVKVWKWTHLSLLCKTVLTGKIAFVCQKWKLGINCGMKFWQLFSSSPNIFQHAHCKTCTTTILHAF